MSILNPVSLWRGYVPAGSPAGTVPTNRHRFWAVIVGLIELIVAVVMLCGARKSIRTVYSGLMDGTFSDNAAGNVPAAITRALQETKGQDVYFNLKEMTYGDGESGRNLSAARRAEAEAEAERAREARLQRAKELREMGAALIEKSNEERDKVEANMEIVRQNASHIYGKRSATNDIHLAEAEVGAISYHETRDEGFRLYYKGRSMEASLVLNDAHEVLPEVRTKPAAPAAPQRRLTFSRR